MTHGPGVFAFKKKCVAKADCLIAAGESKFTNGLRAGLSSKSPIWMAAQ